MTNHGPSVRRIRDELFWTLTERSTGCWLWTAALTTHGYGRMQRHNRPVYSHRYAYELAKGPIPDGLEVRHTCDTPRCINPDHLVLGTHADNMRDAVERGRNFVPAGALHPRAKLTEANVREIRAERARGVDGLILARRFGVSPATIYRAATGRNWRAVEPGVVR